MTTSSPSVSVSAAGELPPHSTDVAEEMSRILLASETVGTSSEQHNLADRYLVSFQKQPIAWIVCEKNLSMPTILRSHATAASSPSLDITPNCHFCGINVTFEMS